MLEEKLKMYAKSDIYPFHMPGHKRAVLDFANPYAIDITEIEGFDNLHHAKGILKEAQEEAAGLYGSRHCYYLVNGSTCGILAAISAAVPRDGRILVARNCHKAVYNAIYLRQLSAEYMYPEQTRWGLQGQITVEQIKQSLECSDVKAVVITSPTYDGIVSDVAGIAEVVHRYGIPLIVDEALSVGDKAFRKKCKDKVAEIMADENVTLLFVTHSLATAKDFCKRGMVLEKGTKLFDGDIDEAIEFYDSRQ